MANAYHLKRLSMIVGKLSGKYVESQIAASFPSSTGYSLRTLQRDFKTLRESFGIDVRFRGGYGYYLVEEAPDTEGYKSMLQNFELLSSIYSDSVMQKFVIPEHRRVIAPEHLRQRIKRVYEAALERHK